MKKRLGASYVKILGLSLAGLAWLVWFYPYPKSGIKPSSPANPTQDLEKPFEKTSDIQENIISSRTKRELEPDTIVKTPPIQADSTDQAQTSWVATDYQYKDIPIGTYIVRTGDTLWELAEGAYGDGTKWRLILQANSKSIGFLPNGTQAKILPGALLIIP